MQKNYEIGRQEKGNRRTRGSLSIWTGGVAVLGRRRVGKTYLVNELFSGRLFFQHAGLSPVEAKEAPERTQLEAQLNHFVRCKDKGRKCLVP